MTVFSLHKGCVRPTAISSRRLLLIMYIASHKMLQTSVVEHSLRKVSCWIMSYFSIIYKIKFIPANHNFYRTLIWKISQFKWFHHELHVTQNVANFQSNICNVVTKVGNKWDNFYVTLRQDGHRFLHFLSHFENKQDRRYSDPKARNGSKIKKKLKFVEKIC